MCKDTVCTFIYHPCDGSCCFHIPCASWNGYHVCHHICLYMVHYHSALRACHTSQGSYHACDDCHSASWSPDTCHHHSQTCDVVCFHNPCHSCRFHLDGGAGDHQALVHHGHCQQEGRLVTCLCRGTSLVPREPLHHVQTCSAKKIHTAIGRQCSCPRSLPKIWTCNYCKHNLDCQ